MEASKGWNGVVILILFGVVCSCEAYDFHVGGREGWVLDRSESLNQWAERNRFQVNDRLVFKYNKGEDSVLEVSKEHYESCDTTNPLVKLDSGESVYVLGRSGPFFFISGNHSHCEKGEKLVLVVLATRNANTKQSPPPLSPSSSSSSSPSPLPVPGKVTPPSSPPSSSENSSSSSSSSLLRVSWVSLRLMVAMVVGAVIY